MTKSDVKIFELQFKRGVRQDLIDNLKGENKPKEGEPILELDTYRLKFGDGQRDYEQLPYFNNSSTVEFSIIDPTSQELLMYDPVSNAWQNKPLYDNASIIYLKDKGLTL